MDISFPAKFSLGAVLLLVAVVLFVLWALRDDDNRAASAERERIRKLRGQRQTDDDKLPPGSNQ